MNGIALVTGASAGLGRNYAHLFAADGHDVVLVARRRGRFEEALSKCRVKYTGTWAKLQAKANGTGATCDAPRFVVGGGTVTDNLTALQWEQKTDDASVHDKDNVYTWSAGGGGGTAADGTVFNNFLAILNFSVFAGQIDWRLPTRAELQTILSEPYPCTTSPCIDQGIFGPTVADDYWSATTYATSTALVSIFRRAHDRMVAVETFAPAGADSISIKETDIGNTPPLGIDPTPVAVTDPNGTPLSMTSTWEAFKVRERMLSRRPPACRHIVQVMGARGSGS